MGQERLGGTHNFQFGYQMNRNSNDILQGFNTAYTQVWPGVSSPYSPQGPTGVSNCAAVEAANLKNSPSAAYKANPNASANMEQLMFTTTARAGIAIAYNNGFYGQDSWSVGKNITINYGLRVEHEYLPAENQPACRNYQAYRLRMG